MASVLLTHRNFFVFDSYQVFLIEGQKSVLHLEIGNILYI
jgi:hypothetical protein